MKKPTLTIGIPAFNEGKNIGKLLSDISNQNFGGLKLISVIVASDASTDDTIAEAKKHKQLPLIVIVNKVRKGVASVQNQISDITNSDVLVILNADIRIVDVNCIKTLVEPIVTKKSDLASGKLEEKDVRNHFEEILRTSMIVKRIIFERFKNGNNLYTCYGVARAFSKELYSKIRYETSIGEDAYSYLYCLANGYKYQHVNNAVVFYKLPDNLNDHKRQSMRFLQSKKKNIEFFGKEFVEHEYSIPIVTLLFGFIIALRSYPIEFTLYLFIYSYLKVKSIFSTGIQNTWEIAASSKVFNI